MRKVINNTYEIEKEIGEGGMSVIYLARHVRLNTKWAIKQVKKGKSKNWDFLAESNILKKLNHPMLVRIVDIFEDENYVYVVEDYVEGIDLKHLLKNEKRITEETAIRWFKELCDVLIYLHEQKPYPIIFRDMKPANIMLQKDGSLKLIDFGIAREYKEESGEDTTIGGTHGYAAPEQFNGKTQSDARTDIYALGMTIYHLVTGKSPLEPPYSIVPVRELNPVLSPGIEYVIAKCIQQEPNNRYQNVRDLLYDLEHIYIFDNAYKKYLSNKRRRNLLPFILAGLGSLCIISSLYLKSLEIEKKYNQLLQLALQATGEESIDYYREAEVVDSKRQEAYLGEIKTLFEIAKYNSVIERVSELERSNKISIINNKEIYIILGNSFFELANYSEAAETYKKVADISEITDSDVLINYAAAIGRNGDIDLAQSIINDISSNIDETQVIYMQGELLYLQKKYKDAAIKFREVIDDSKTSDSLLRRAYISLAETYRDSKKLSPDDDQAITDANNKLINLIDEAQNIKGMTGSSVLWEMKGQAYSNRGHEENNIEDFLSAANAYLQVIRLGINKQYLYGNVFTCYNAAGDYESANNILNEYEAAWPQSYEPHAYRALMYAEQQNGKEYPDYSEAIKEYNIAMSLVQGSDNSQLLDQLENLMQLLKDNGY